MKNILILLKKDIKDSLRNGEIIFFLFALVCISIGINYGPSIFRQKGQTKIVVCAPIPSEFIELLRTKFDNIVFAKSAEEANLLIEKGKASLAIFVPPDLLQRIKIGEKPEIKLLVDVTRPLNIVSDITFIKKTLEQFKDILPVRFTISTLGNISRSQIVLDLWLSISIMLIAFFLLPQNIVDEKSQQNTLSALLLTPVSESQFLLSKGLWATLLCLANSLLILVLSNALLLGRIEVLLLVIILGTICVSGIGTFVSIISEAPSITVVTSAIIGVILMMSGVLAPYSEILEKICWVFPSYHLFIGIKKSLFYKCSFLEVWTNVVALGGWVAISFWANLIAIRRQKS
ncbi:MAG: ABC transporter permease [Candidatus Edwardsbacteria bacterium]